MSIPKELQHLLSIDPETMGGAICFAGTRIPVSILLDNHRVGVSMDEFLDEYPDLTRPVIQQVLDWEDRKAREALGLEQAS